MTDLGIQDKEDNPNLHDSIIDYSYEISYVSEQQIPVSLINPIQESQYEKVKLIGHGSFGKVYLVKNINSQQNYVMKQMSTFNKTENEIQELLKESLILQSLDHPNIIKFQDQFMDKKQKLNIIMEYAQNGDLQQYIKAREGQLLTESSVIEWCNQLISAIGYMQQKKILHRDLKCENIFLTNDMIVKLGDFGISKVLSGTKEQAKTFVGTPYYISPEILQGKVQYSYSKPYQFKSDLWSLGVIVYELCSLKRPFEADSLHFLAMKILRGKYKLLNQSLYSSNLRNLVQNLLQLEPAKRLNIDQIRGLPIFADTKHHKVENLKNKQQTSLKKNQNLPFKVNSNEIKNTKITQKNPNKLINLNGNEKKQVTGIQQHDKGQVQSNKKFDRDQQRKNMSEDIQKKKIEQKESKQQQLADKKLDQIQIVPQAIKVRQLNESEELSLQYIVTESTKLEELRQLLEDQMGMENFLTSYKIISDTIEVLGLEQIEEKYSKSNYVELLPFMDKVSIDKYLPFLFTLIFLEQDLQQ